jgi:hypothetical protein
MIYKQKHSLGIALFVLILISILSLYSIFNKKNDSVLSVLDKNTQGQTTEPSQRVSETGPLSIKLKNSTIDVPFIKDTKQLAEAEPSKRKLSKAERFDEAQAYERLRTLDPALGYVPHDRRAKAIEQTLRIQAEMDKNALFSRGNLENARWVARGPGNVGGRVRAVMFDISDPTYQTVFAGGSTGGLFKTTNINDRNAQWTQINDWLANLTVSSLAQDPRNPNVMYLGTGDVDGNDANGLGIYRSTDGGNNWSLIPATANSNFGLVSSMVINPNDGHIIAATFSGIYKSIDNGANWYKVLGSGIATGGTNDKFFTILRGSDGRLYACNAGNIFRSTGNGEIGTWVNISTTESGFQRGWSRIEIGFAPTNPNIIYAIGSLGGRGTAIYRSNNGGNTWSAGTKPVWKDLCGSTPSDNDFTRGQAGYDLSLVVSPDDANTVFVGGIDLFRSVNAGSSWTQMSSWAACQGFAYVHADQHGALFHPTNPNILYVGTDGGIFRIENPKTSFVASERNNGFVTTQFYACAIHPDSSVNHFMAGAQDNGTIIVRSATTGNAAKVLGGDGMYCFIDQNEPNIQIASLQEGQWALSTNGGSSFSAGTSSDGFFITIADYDDRSNILYTQTRNADIFRWKIGKNSGELVDIAGVSFNNNPSNIYVDPNIPNRIYIGTFDGRIHRVDKTDVGSSLTEAVTIGSFQGAISSIDVEKGDTNHILVTLSSYGVQSVYESKNGGQTWTGSEGNLPDMPIRWGIFNPSDPKQALLATETGVWSTNNINGAQTIWQPPFPNKGTPLVRTDMLQIRQSDKMVLAATYGRGMWTTNFFGKPQAAIDYSGVAYVNFPTILRGTPSVAAENYLWNLGNNKTDTLETVNQTYTQTGTYPISLTINNTQNLTAQGSIKVLPRLPMSYKKGASGYDGSFEGADTHFGAFSPVGPKFTRGRSSILGKAGVNSGSNAYVLGLTDPIYPRNTRAYLYLPMFDMTQKGIYQFSFWTVYDIQNGYDGMVLEYSLNGGLSWQIIGSKDDPSWYNYRNTTITDGAFPIGTSYFSGILEDWTRYKLNISALSGNANVAFRFSFLADGDNANGSGVAIDDVEVTRYDGALKTAVVSQSGSFNKNGVSVDLQFQTQPEYNAKNFLIEISENGRTFRQVNTVKAVGISTEEQQNYKAQIDGTPFDIYYFRIKSLNEDAAANYKEEFYTPTFVVKRSKDAPLSINRAFPSPFSNFIGVTFTDIVKETVDFALYDVAGRRILEEKVQMNGVIHEFKTVGLPKGIYLLQVKIGNNKAETVKIFGGN